MIGSFAVLHLFGAVTFVQGAASRLGDTDCENFHGGFWAQPANAASSLSYALVGVAIAWWGARRTDVKNADSLILGAALILAGAGSVDFHGPASSVARFFHDGSVGLVLVFMFSFDLGILRSWQPSRSYWLFAVLSVVLATPLLIEPDSSIPLTAVGAIAFLVVDVAVIRAGHRPLGAHPGAGRRRIAYVTTLVTLLAAGIINVLSRTDAPLCDPDSLVQGHGIWHALTAIAFGGWAVAALPRHEGSSSSPQDESDPIGTRA